MCVKNVYVCGVVCVHTHSSAGALGEQKRRSDLQVVVRPKLRPTAGQQALSTTKPFLQPQKVLLNSDTFIVSLTKFPRHFQILL